MDRHRPLTALLSIVVLSTLGFSCAALQNIQQAVSNVMRCQFKIAGLSDFMLLGVPLSGKNSLTLQDGLQIIPAFRDHRFPASFRLNIAAVNPNTGQGGSKAASATLTGFAWSLVIDSIQTISGDIASPVTIPSTGQSTIIPLRMDLDLYSFFHDRGYDGLVKLALALGGANASTGRVQLRARPTIDTPIGAISYPGTITIVDSEFRNQ